MKTSKLGRWFKGGKNRKKGPPRRVTLRPLSEYSTYWLVPMSLGLLSATDFTLWSKF